MTRAISYPGIHKQVIDTQLCYRVYRMALEGKYYKSVLKNNADCKQKGPEKGFCCIVIFVRLFTNTDKPT